MSYSVSRVKWEHAAPLLKNVREKVFVCEWRIPKRIEFDNDDRTAFHILICDDITQEPIATGRILASGEISRVAVIMPYRKHNIDKIILKRLFKIAQELELNEVFIHSPLESVNKLVKQNFNQVGGVFMEAGMPRQRMVCPIENAINTMSNSKYYLNH
jgi:predicted GNAT family N-acyltransferase